MLWLGIEGRKKLKTLETSMNALQDELERFHRAFKQLEMEWGDVLDRLNHQVGRISARSRRAETAQQRNGPESEIDEISQEILSMRRRGP